MLKHTGLWQPRLHCNCRTDDSPVWFFRLLLAITRIPPVTLVYLAHSWTDYRISNCVTQPPQNDVAIMRVIPGLTLKPVHTERVASRGRDHICLLASNVCIFIQLSITSFSVTSLSITSLSTDVIWWWSPIATRTFWPFIVIGSPIAYNV